MNEVERITEKPLSADDLATRIDAIIQTLTKDQLRFVVALQEYPTKRQAAEAIGVKPDTAYSWNGRIEEAARLIAMERLEAAKAIRRNALVKAIAVKIAGLDSKSERVRQQTATEIIEWELGKAQQSMDLTTGGDPIQVVSVGFDTDRV